MKDGVVILNFARDVLVNEDDLAEALKSGKVKKYVTDFANPKSVAMENTIVIPHLGVPQKSPRTTARRWQSRRSWIIWRMATSAIP